MLGLQHYYWDIMIDYRPLVFERRVVKAVGHFGVVRLAKSPLGTPLKEREAAGQESRSHWASVQVLGTTRLSVQVQRTGQRTPKDKAEHLGEMTQPLVLHFCCIGRIRIVLVSKHKIKINLLVLLNFVKSRTTACIGSLQCENSTIFQTISIVTLQVFNNKSVLNNF